MYPSSRFLPREKIKVGYSKLVESQLIQKFNNLILILIKKDEDSKNPVNLQPNILDISIDKIHQFHRQWKSTVFLGNTNFLVALSLSTAYGKQLIFPLTREWAEEVAKSGVKINKFLSQILFNFYLLSKCLISIYKSLVFLYHSIHKNQDNFQNHSPQYNMVYIPNLQQGHFSGDFEYNFIGWLKKKEFPNSDLIVIHSNPQIKREELEHENISLQFVNFSWRWDSGIVKDFTFRLILVVKCLLYFLSHKNKRLVLLHLNEILLAQYTYSTSPKNNIRYLLFDQSHGSLMPLWASILNRRENRNILFFNATAAEPQLESGAEFKPNLWANASWEEIWVIDIVQRIKLQSVVLKSEIRFKEIGVPGWVDTHAFIPKVSAAIALFDSEPQKNLYYLSPNISLGMYTQEFYEQFFHNILEKAKYYNFTIFHKVKKSTNKHAEPFYNKIRNELTFKFNNVYQTINPNIAPKKLLESSIACICQPISTTGLIARSLNLPTMYYDPLNKINPNDQSLRGIPIIYSTELETWFDNLRRSLK